MTKYQRSLNLEHVILVGRVVRRDYLTGITYDYGVRWDIEVNKCAWSNHTVISNLCPPLSMS